MLMKDFTNELLECGRKVFSIDKRVSEDKKTTTIFVLFDDGEKWEETFENKRSVQKNYSLLRRKLLGVFL